MKTITANKKARIEAPKIENGIVAFQLVDFVINFFGNEIKTTLDTKIMEDGRQLVIDGDGFIPEGFEL